MFTNHLYIISNYDDIISKCVFWHVVPMAYIWQNQHTRELINAQKYVTQVKQQRPESPSITLTWHAWNKAKTTNYFAKLTNKAVN